VRQKFANLLPLIATQWIETKAALKVQGGCKLFFFPLTRFAFISLCLSLLLPFLSQLYSFVTCLFAVLVLVWTSFYRHHASIFTFNIWKEYRDSRRRRPFWFEEFSFFLSLIITLDSIIYCEEILFSSQSLCFFSISCY
jgi:hypothetical protein